MQRLLTVDQAAATQYADLVPGTTANRQILAIGNSNTYGGAGGTYATASGGNALSALITPHELGHSLGGLQDEYGYYARGERGAPYQGGEPSSIHHTLLTEQQMRDRHQRWWRWLGEPSESGGTIGRYEGGMYAGTGVWRPSAHSMMKALVYGKLGVPRVVPWDDVPPGYGRHQVEYRAIDATGNIGGARRFAVTLLRPAPTCTSTVNGVTTSVVVVGSTISGPLSVTGSRTPDPAALAGNTIDGPLSCSGNSPSPVDLGAPNRVTGPRSGQGARL